LAPRSRRQTFPSRPARVVFLLEELNFGGTQRQTLELARRLDRGKFESEIWLLRSGTNLSPLAQSWQIPVIRLGEKPLVGPLSLMHLWQRLHQEDIDLFLLLTAIPNIWGRLLGKMAGLPCIVGNIRSKTANRQHERWLWPLAHHLICNNEHLQDLLISRYSVPPPRLSMIPNGVDTDYFKPPPTRGGLEKIKILSIGRLVPDKDQETLIEAFRLVLQDHPTAELCLLGDGPRQSSLQQLMEQILPADRAFLLPGQVDIRPYLQEASIFALSSVTEALPNVLLEAMAAGLPVVATQVGGIPEVVKPNETGWLVPPREPALLAGALSTLLADADRRQAFGQAGRERVVENFSFSRMVSRYEALFDDLLSRPQKVS
jgi:glycosyltransferase involved in cell wall biosynthesis